MEELLSNGKQYVCMAVAALGLSGLPNSAALSAVPDLRGQTVARRLSIRNTLDVRRISSAVISPDGKSVAYVVTQPILERNTYRALLYVASATSSRSALGRAEARHLRAVRWSPDSKMIFYISDSSGRDQLWRIPAESGKSEQLTSVTDEIPKFWQLSLSDLYLPYEVSRDGKRIVFAVSNTTAARQEQNAKIQGGVVYDGGAVDSLTDPRHAPLPFELYSLDLDTRQAVKIWMTPTFEGRNSGVPEFRLSPDGTKIALLHRTSRDFRFQLSLLDLVTGVIRPLQTDLVYTMGLRWSEDGRSIVFFSRGPASKNEIVKGGAFTLPVYAFRLQDSSLHQIEAQNTDPNQSQSLFYNDSEASRKLAKELEQQTDYLFSSCTLDGQKTRAACIRQAPTTPPEVVTIELRNGAPTGAAQTLTHVNPELDSVLLGQIGQLTYRISDGTTHTGTLIKPVGYVEGKKYPLVVMVESGIVVGRRFITNGPYFTSWPSQAFAGHGYFVLILGPTLAEAGYLPGDFANAKRIEVDAPVDQIKAAVDWLVERGLVDSTRMGIMGWSFGGFYVNYIATQHPDWFRAAAFGEGGNHDSAPYWLYDNRWREYERRFYGGGPYGKYYPRWKEIAPDLNLDRLRVPLLMEYSGAYLIGLNKYNAIVEQGGQAELVLYLDDEHIFFQPLNIYNSMMRNYDWFNFWLLGEEDSDPGKAQQYSRWRKLRRQQREKQNGLTDQ